MKTRYKHTQFKPVLAFCGLFLLFASFTFVQINQDIFTKKYPCIQYDENIIESEKFLFSFFNKLDHFVENASGKINIVHIGDSHIQADYLSSETRKLFQETFGNGGRGFIFPFKVANTNNPTNYNQFFKGTWESCKATQADETCVLGINGISVSTSDSDAYLSIFPTKNRKKDLSFDKIKLFYQRDENSFMPVFTSYWDKLFFFDEQPMKDGYSQIYFNSPQDTLRMSFLKSFNAQDRFRLFGLSLENSNPGLLYHAIGLNGAFTKSFNKSDLFSDHLKALEPDLVIISLGTNDNFLPSKRFCKFCIKDNLRTLLENVRASRPGVSILLVTPGDVYLRDGTHNQNNDIFREIIKELSEEYSCGIWDFNKVMGGNYSIKCWNRLGLAQSDYVHFTKTGYEVQGQLLYRAILDAYEKRFN